MFYVFPNPRSHLRKHKTVKWRTVRICFLIHLIKITRHKHQGVTGKIWASVPKVLSRIKLITLALSSAPPPPNSTPPSRKPINKRSSWNEGAVRTRRGWKPVWQQAEQWSCDTRRVWFRWISCADADRQASPAACRWDEMSSSNHFISQRSIRYDPKCQPWVRFISCLQRYRQPPRTKIDGTV